MRSSRLGLWLDALRVELSVARHRLADRKLLMASLKLLLVMAVLFLIGFLALSRFSDPDALLSYVRSAGVWAPLLIIGLIVLEVVIAPLPGTFIMVAAGALFGTWLGALYAYVGNVIGSSLAFFLARRFGRGLVRRLVSRPLLERYDGFFNAHQELFVVFYALPVVPVDVLSFTCGLSSMRWRRFLLVMTLGFIPNTLLLSFLGERLAGLSFFFMALYTVLFLVVFSLLAWLFRLLVSRVGQKKHI